jgi:hypothetical protein
MIGILINKNLCFYYWLRKRIGKEWAFRVVNQIEKIILIFGREQMNRETLRKKGGVLEDKSGIDQPTLYDI